MPPTPRPAGFTLDCTTCGYVLRSGRDLAGRIVVCPACETRLFVPTEPLSPAGDMLVTTPPPQHAGQ